MLSSFDDLQRRRCGPPDDKSMDLSLLSRQPSESARLVVQRNLGGLAPDLAGGVFLFCFLFWRGGVEKVGFPPIAPTYLYIPSS